MRARILYLVFFLFLNFLYAQSSFIQIGASGHDGINDLAIDKKQNIYITGFFQGTFDELRSKGDSDAFIAKLNSDNKIVWLKSYGSDYKNKQEITEYGKYIRLDKYENSYTSGLFYKALNSEDEIISKGKQDLFLVKHDRDGNLVWSKTFGTVNNENLKGLFLVDSHIYLVAEYGVEGKYNTNRNLILKLDLNGNLLWQKNIDHENSSDIRVLDTKQSINSLYFLIDDDNNKHIIRFDLSNETLDQKFKITDNNLISFDLIDNGLFTLQLDEKIGFNLIKRDLIGKVIWIKDYSENNKNLNLSKVVSSGNKIVVIGNYLNSKDYDSVIFEVNNLGELSTPYHLSGNYQNKIMKYYFRKDDLFLVGQFYNSVNLENVQLYSNGRTDSFIEVKESVFRTDSSDNDNYLIYPNPNNGEFYIKNSSDVKFIMIYDMSGRLIYNKDYIQNPTDKVKLYNFSSGVYSIEIFNLKGEKKSQKIILNK